MEQSRVAYTFEKCLGRGGYGEVYLATASRPGGLVRKVAVKVLRTGIAREEDALRRLRDEGRMLAMLDHPAILAVHEMTRIDGRVALVTEYVEGVDASKCCKKGSLLPQRAVIGIIGEVAAALHTASNTPSPETGKPLALIHRDIKPENIRIGKHGDVKLLDFGIARSTEMDREAQTVAGSLPFTPGYAAPECFNEGLQSAASDVFALGATAFRMLAGERLFEATETARQFITVSAPERYNPFLKGRLAKIEGDPRVTALVAEMLAFDQEQRPTSLQVSQRCEALADTLDGLTHVRWARATQMPEIKALADAELTGRTIEADDIVGGAAGGSGRSRSPSLASSLPPAVELPPEATTELPRSSPKSAWEPPASTPPSIQPPPRPSPRSSAPPPVPEGLSNTSIKPDTAPFLRPRPSAPDGRDTGGETLVPRDATTVPDGGFAFPRPGASPLDRSADGPLGRSADGPTPLSALGPLDSLPIPDHGLESLPGGVTAGMVAQSQDPTLPTAGRAPPASAVQTVRLDRTRLPETARPEPRKAPAPTGGGWLWKVVVALVGASAVAAVGLAVTLGVAWLLWG